MYIFLKNTHNNYTGGFMKRIDFEKLEHFMNKKKNKVNNNNVEFSKDLKEDSIDVSSNYQDTDQIIELTEKTLKKHYSKNKK
jgi:NAD-dependent DNA ligase